MAEQRAIYELPESVSIPYNAYLVTTIDDLTRKVTLETLAKSINGDVKTPSNITYYSSSYMENIITDLQQRITNINQVVLNTSDDLTDLIAALEAALNTHISNYNTFKDTINNIIIPQLQDDILNHTHNYAGSSTPGGAATTALACTGNSATASKLATARTIALSGDVSGSGSFDGSGNLTITTAVADDSHNHTIANIDTLQTALNAKQNKITYGTGSALSQSLSIGDFYVEYF